ESRAHEAERKLRARGRSEADALWGILEQQRAAIRAQLAAEQLLLFSDAEHPQKDQYERDRRHMEERRRAIDDELVQEPTQLEALYQVQLTRIEPVGLAFLWPETRA